MRRRSRPPSRETDGEAVLYGGVPILAVFHSSSAGQTRGSGEVWVNDLPYLQAVDVAGTGGQHPQLLQPGGVHGGGVPGEAALAAHPEADLSGRHERLAAKRRHGLRRQCGAPWTVGGVTVKGSTLRSILGLRSACFEWEVEDGKLVFFVTGYGHGVGMSQYGANQMAEEGADYREILTHYYTGVTVEPYTSAALG